MESSKPVVLTRTAQLRAITSPVAHQIISVMERTRRSTVSELAHRVGIPAGSLYYHVRKLCRAGVLREHGKRSTGGRREVVYELTGSEVVLDPTATGRAFVDQLGRTYRSRLRAVERGVSAALRSGRTIRKGRRRNLTLAQHHAVLSARNRAELFRRIEELEAFVIENDDPEGEEFTHVTIAAFPVVRDR